MNENSPKKSPATVTSEPRELEHEIRLRAEELYEERGREDGHELDDWLRAEEEITKKNTKKRIQWPSGGRFLIEWRENGKRLRASAGDTPPPKP